jgi:hypothetical protein
MSIKEQCAALAKRLWSIHPREIQDMGVTQEQFYAAEIEKLVVAHQRSSAATEQATGRYEFPYNRTFQAIAAATSVYAEGVGVNVSVKAFQEAFNSFPDAHPLNEPQGVSETAWRIEHDGFEGVKIGSYVTLEGKRGVVLQQIGTRVVHVYGEKWLTSPLSRPESK